MAKRPAEDFSVLRRLLALARDFLQASDLSNVLEMAGQAVSELLHSDGSLLLVLDGKEEYVSEFGNRKGFGPVPDRSELLKHARRAITDRTPILLPEVAPNSGLRDGDLPSFGIASLIAYPFPPGKPLGALVSVWYRQGHRKELAQLIPILRLLGEITGAALGNVGFRQSLEDRIVAKTEELAEAERMHAVELVRRDSIEEDIHRLAVTDVMTGLLNRRGFFLHAERSIKLARRQQVQSALIFIDIDRLKTVNDAHGHDVGDDLIKDTGQILQHCFRDADVVARIGGDEFAVFTIDTAQADVLRTRIQEGRADFVARGDRAYPISFSIGIVQCDPMCDLSLTEYLRQADQLMYEQKRKHIPAQ
ncbi:diguanylate cyclase [Azoarcus sp. KH32C]|uniref:GGDEF domain-containing protein n=1 Tax=Azoarcus sp. KH32C TaxID=748247 RepID=UPI000238701C|nr:GGDEF domain-containing protein [Azoarcus sp. KH32C]BAL25005.1 hypothetical protein AZKH_2699 [Azoarcus sp. KH32C]